MSDEAKELQSVSRRNFLELVGKGSFTAAMVAGAAGVLSSSEAVAQTAAEEHDYAAGSSGHAATESR